MGERDARHRLISIAHIEKKFGELAAIIGNYVFASLASINAHVSEDVCFSDHLRGARRDIEHAVGQQCVGDGQLQREVTAGADRLRSNKH